MELVNLSQLILFLVVMLMYYPLTVYFLMQMEIYSVQGVSCELGAQMEEFQLIYSGGQEPYDISWEIFDATNPVLTPVSNH